jgi:predicted nucleic acid-binding Zn ribbon protein
MLLYEYQCQNCGVLAELWGAPDVHFVICHVCGLRMIRTSSDPIAIITQKESPCAKS